MKGLIKKYDGRKYLLKEYLSVIFIFAILIGFGIYQVIRIGEYNEVFLSTHFNDEVMDVYQQKSFLFVHLRNRTKRIEIRNPSGR